MFTIGEITVEEKIASVNFACDLEKCKGACCTLKGGRGAPLLENEIDEIEKAFPVVSKYLPKEHLEWIEEYGPVEEYAGKATTQCVDERACVFVYYEQGIAKCSFEKAFFRGEIEWRKPISCHLFPIRVDHWDGDRIRFEYLHECRPALQRGEQEKIPLFKFLKDALIRLYDTEWYEQFETECKRRMSVSQIRE